MRFGRFGCGTRLTGPLRTWRRWQACGTCTWGGYGADSLRAVDLPRLHLLSLYDMPYSLEGIEQMTSLEWLNLCGMGPVTWSDSVHTINITDCRFEDYTPLLRVPGLKEVGAWDETCLQGLERDCPEGTRTFQVTGP